MEKVRNRQKKCHVLSYLLFERPGGLLAFVVGRTIEKIIRDPKFVAILQKVAHQQSNSYSNAVIRMCCVYSTF